MYGSTLDSVSNSKQLWTSPFLTLNLSFLMQTIEDIVLSSFSLTLTAYDSIIQAWLSVIIVILSGYGVFIEFRHTYWCWLWPILVKMISLWPSMREYISWVGCMFERARVNLWFEFQGHLTVITARSVSYMPSLLEPHWSSEDSTNRKPKKSSQVFWVGTKRFL